MDLKIFFLCLGLFSFATEAWSLGTIRLPDELRKKYEAPVNRTLGLESAKLEVRRLDVHGAQTYHFQLGKLTPKQFHEIRQKMAFPFNSKLPLVEYDSEKNYSFTDFLIPKMQATLGKVLASTEESPWFEKLSGSAEYEIESNCWSTAFDVLQSVSHPLTSYMYLHTDDHEMTEILKDPKYSREIQANELKPYDFILYYWITPEGKFFLDHVAVSIGADLVFQKTGNQEIDFHEVRPLEIVTDQRKKLNEGQPIITEYRRMAAPFPHPYQLWGAKAKNLLSSEELKAIPADFQEQVVVMPMDNGSRQFKRIRPLQLIKTSQGSFSYDPADSLSKEFKVPPVIGDLMDGTLGYADKLLKKKACQMKGVSYAKVNEVSEDSFRVRIEGSFEEDSACLTPAGKEQKIFWIPQDQLRSNL